MKFILFLIASIIAASCSSSQKCGKVEKDEKSEAPKHKDTRPHEPRD